MDNLSLFIFLALIAEILGTIGGFGSSLFFIPIASYFLDFESVLGITALFHISSNLSKIYLFRKGFDKKLIVTIGIPAVIFVIIGARMSKYVDTTILEFILACFLVIISISFLSFKSLEVKPTIKNSILGGIFSGLTAGLFGTGGAIRGITLASFNLTTEVFIATSAIIDLAIDSSRTVVYFYNGFIHFHDLYLIPILFFVSFAGTLIGKQILTKVSQDQFKKMVLILILITGLITFLKLYFK